MKSHWYRGFVLGFLLATVLAAGVYRATVGAPKPIVNFDALVEWHAKATPEMRTEMGAKLHLK